MAVEITNQNLFGKAAANALVKIGQARLTSWETVRHTNAVASAVVQIEENGAFMEYHAADRSMTVWSQKSLGIYTANGTCDCEAGRRSFICWHRTAARLWTRYLELVKAEDDAALEKAARLSEFAERLAEMPRIASVRTKTTPEKTADEDAPYLKPTNHAPAIRIGGIRIN